MSSVSSDKNINHFVAEEVGVVAFLEGWSTTSDGNEECTVCLTCVVADNAFRVFLQM